MDGTNRLPLSRRQFGFGLGAAAALALTGCAPGSSGDSASGAQSSQSVKTDPAAIGNATIAVLDVWSDKNTPTYRWITSIESSFMKKYPKIKVKRRTGTFSDLNTTLRLKLSDPNTPDVVPANNGWQGIGELSKAKLILNLDDYSKAYGWDKRLPATVVRQQTVTLDGKQLGNGSLFGVPTALGGLIQVYYNRAKLQSLRLSVPKTLQGFEDALEKARAKGEIPISLGIQDKTAGTALLFALQDIYGEKQKIADFVYSVGNVHLADTGMTRAAATVQKWNTQGYYLSNYEGITGSDAAQKFVEGNGLFMFFYSDSLPVTNTAEADKFGAFLLPYESSPAKSGTGATSGSFSIASGSKNKDAAALFLDYVSSPEAGQVAVQVGVTPFLGEYSSPSGQSLLGDQIAELTQLQKANGFLPYFDWSSPTMLDTLGTQVQLLLASRTTAQGLVKAGQADYTKFRSRQ